VERARLSSSLSVRSSARFGGLHGFSLCNGFQLGSFFSLRAVAQAGSTCSIFGRNLARNSVSVQCYTTLGSTFSFRSAGRFGPNQPGYGLSVIAAMHLGSAFSLRASVKAGSGFSVWGKAAQARTSVVSQVHLASVLSVRFASRCGRNGGSVMNFLQLGSSLSCRTALRLGSSVSVTGCGHLLGSVMRISAHHFVALASSLSIRANSRAAERVSAYTFVSLGSSFSIRAFLRVSGAVSVAGVKPGPSQLSRFSCLNFVHLASSVSVRSSNTRVASKVGGGCSIFNYMCLGSTLSVRGFVRLADQVSAGTTAIGTGSQLSVYACTGFSSSLSIRSSVKTTGKLSILHAMHLGHRSASDPSRDFVGAPAALCLIWFPSGRVFQFVHLHATARHCQSAAMRWCSRR